MNAEILIPLFGRKTTVAGETGGRKGAEKAKWLGEKWGAGARQRCGARSGTDEAQFDVESGQILPVAIGGDGGEAEMAGEGETGTVA